MLQRIQSIYLLLIAITSTSFLTFPFATADKSGNKNFADGVFNIQDDIIFYISMSLLIAIPLIAIFLFKNRKLQKSITWLLVFIGTFIIGLIAGTILKESAHEFPNFSLGFGSAIPCITIIFSFLAIYGINKDDKLVKSMDRLR